MKKTNLPEERRQAIIGGINNAREEFKRLIGILNKNTEGVKLTKAKEELQKILGGRASSWIGGTYRIFEDQNKGLFKLFSRYTPTAQAEEGAINFFKKRLLDEDPSLASKPNLLEREAVIQTKSLINSVKKLK